MAVTFLDSKLCHAPSTQSLSVREVLACPFGLEGDIQVLLLLYPWLHVCPFHCYVCSCLQSPVPRQKQAQAGCNKLSQQFVHAKSLQSCVFCGLWTVARQALCLIILQAKILEQSLLLYPSRGRLHLKVPSSVPGFALALHKAPGLCR